MVSEGDYRVVRKEGWGIGRGDKVIHKMVGIGVVHGVVGVGIKTHLVGEIRLHLLVLFKVKALVQIKALHLILLLLLLELERGLKVLELLRLTKHVCGLLLESTLMQCLLLLLLLLLLIVDK